MNHIIFERADGGVSIGGPNTKIIAAMTGDGGLSTRPGEPISPEHLAYIERYTGNRIPNLPKEQESCRTCPRRSQPDYDISSCCSEIATNLASQAILDQGQTRPLIELDYEVSKSVIIDGIPELIARECLEGKAFGGLTEDEARRRLTARHAENVRVQVGPVVATHTCADTDIPGNYDRSLFRESWQWVNNQVQVNMPKARFIHLGQIRKVRDAELVKLDVAFTRCGNGGCRRAATNSRPETGAA